MKISKNGYIFPFDDENRLKLESINIILISRFII